MSRSVDDVAADPSVPRVRWPGKGLPPLGLLAFLGLFGEGATGDWSAVYLRDGAGAGPGLAAVGYAGYSLATAAGRATGDHLLRRLGPVTMLRASAWLAAVGLTTALASPSPVIAVAGFSAVGLGLANMVPNLFTTAARRLENGPAVVLILVVGAAVLIAQGAIFVHPRRR